MPENNPDVQPENNKDQAPKEKKQTQSGLRGWWGGLSTPIKALLALAAGFILAGVLAVVLTTSGNENILPDEAPAPAPAEPDPDQQLPEGGSADRITGIRITPFSQTIEGDTGSKINPITIANGSAKNIKVIVNYVPAARNTLQGSPVYGLSNKTIAAGKKEVRPDVNAFQLAPGASRQVGGTIVGKPKEGIGIFGVMIFSIDDGTTSQTDEPIAAGVNIRIKRLYRVAAIVNVQFPGKARQSFDIQRIRAVQEDTGIKFLTRVRNTGNFITSIEGEITITGAEGPVASIPVPDQGSLPGNERDLSASDAIQNLPPGRYRADVNLSSRTNNATASWEFRIDENGNLPSPAAEFNLQASPSIVKISQPYSVRVQLRNDGTKDFATKGRISLYRTGETEILQQKTISLDNVSPDDITENTVDFPGISEAGNYELVLVAETDDGIALGQRVGTILVREQVEEATWDEELRNWMSANPIGTLVVGVGIVGLLLLMGISLYLLFQRRKK